MPAALSTINNWNCYLELIHAKNKPRCHHPRPSYFRVLFRIGTGYHIALLCIDCGMNLRGPGVWVPRREIQGDPDALFESPWHLRPSAAEPSLFGEAGEGI